MIKQLFLLAILIFYWIINCCISIKVLYGTNVQAYIFQFDDSEFQSDLPELDAPPTLESILNDDETMSVLEEEEIAIPSAVQAFKDSQSLDTSSLSSQDSSLTDKPLKKER